MLLIAVTKITAPKEHLDHIAEAFRKAAPDLKQFPGCKGFELWLNETTLQAISRWDSRESMEGYTKSNTFLAHHAGGASTTPGSEIEYYEGDVLL
jgi:heme-degrading monooxygenase HmoA